MTYYKEAQAFREQMAAGLTSPPADIKIPAHAPAPAPKPPISRLLDPSTVDDPRRLSPNLRLTEIWRRHDFIAGDTRPAIGLSATWGSEHDVMVQPFTRLIGNAIAANRDNADRFTGVSPTSHLLSRLNPKIAQGLIEPLTTLAAESGHSIRVHLGDRTLHSIPTLTIDPNGQINGTMTTIADPSIKMRVDAEILRSYPVTTFADIAAHLNQAAHNPVPPHLEGKVFTFQSWRQTQKAEDAPAPLTFNDRHWLNTADRLTGIRDTNDISGKYRSPSDTEAARYLIHSIDTRLATDQQFAEKALGLQERPVVARSIAEAITIHSLAEAAHLVNSTRNTSVDELLRVDHLRHEFRLSLARHFPLPDHKVLFDRTGELARESAYNLTEARSPAQQIRRVKVGVEFEAIPLAAAALELPLNAEAQFKIQNQNGQLRAELHFPRDSNLPPMQSAPIDPSHLSGYPREGTIQANSLLATTTSAKEGYVILDPRDIKPAPTAQLTQEVAIRSR